MENTETITVYVKTQFGTGDLYIISQKIYLNAFTKIVQQSGITEGVPYKLVFKGQELMNPEKTLQQYSIQDHSTISIVEIQKSLKIEQKFPLKFVFNGEQKQLMCYPIDKVKQIKQKIKDKLGLESVNQRLFYLGTQLQDEEVILDIGIKPNGIIKVIESKLDQSLSQTLSKQNGNFFRFKVVKSGSSENKQFKFGGNQQKQFGPSPLTPDPPQDNTKPLFQSFFQRWGLKELQLKEVKSQYENGAQSPKISQDNIKKQSFQYNQEVEVELAESVRLTNENSSSYLMGKKHKLSFLNKKTKKMYHLNVPETIKIQNIKMTISQFQGVHADQINIINPLDKQIISWQFLSEKLKIGQWETTLLIELKDQQKKE